MKSLTEEFISSLKTLWGKECWGFVAGKGTGSVVGIDFGKKFVRNKRLTNKYLTEEQKKYEGELSFLIWCSWRLDSDKAVICGSADSNANDGTMIKGLGNLIGKRIESVEISFPSFDISLKFNDFFLFKVFCDQTDPDEYENYSFYTLDKVYTVEPRSFLNYEERKKEMIMLPEI